MLAFAAAMEKMERHGGCGVTALVRADGGAWCGGACAIPICSSLLVVREGWWSVRVVAADAEARRWCCGNSRWSEMMARCYGCVREDGTVVVLLLQLMVVRELAEKIT